MSNSSILHIDKTLSGATTPGQSGPGHYGNEWVLHIPQSSKYGASPSNCLMSYPGHSLVGGSYPLPTCKSVYSTASVDRTFKGNSSLITILAPYFFIICLDYVLRTSINKMKDNGFKRHEFKPWRRLIAFHIALIPLGKV